MALAFGVWAGGNGRFLPPCRPICHKSEAGRQLGPWDTAGYCLGSHLLGLGLRVKKLRHVRAAILCPLGNTYYDDSIVFFHAAVLESLFPAPRHVTSMEIAPFLSPFLAGSSEGPSARRLIQPVGSSTATD